MSESPFYYISPDTDSDSNEAEIRYYSDSSDSSTGWNKYFPPISTGSSKKKSPTSDQTAQLVNQLPNALAEALGTAVKNLKRLSQEGPSENPSKPGRPPKQVLFLPSPKMQAAFEEKKKTAKKTNNSYKGKGKKPMK